MAYSNPETGSTGPLRVAALIAVAVGAVGSLAFMLRAGRHNDSRVLIMLFAGWVLAPFAALLWANLAAKRWLSLTRTVLYCETVLVAVGSLAIYGAVAFGPPRAHTAAPFLVIPPASCLLAAIVVGAAGLLARR